MIGNWKRGAVVGIGAAAILTAGGGAAMAVSQGGVHKAVPAASCTVATKPTGLKATGSVSAPAGTATARALPKRLHGVAGSCPIPTGPGCAVAFSIAGPDGLPAKPARPAKAVKAASGKDFAVITSRVAAGKPTTVGRCGIVKFVPCKHIPGVNGAGLKSIAAKKIAAATAAQAPKPLVIRCLAPGKAKH